MSRNHRPINRKLGATSVVRPIEVFKQLEEMAANNNGNVSNKQQTYAKMQELQKSIVTKPMGYDMQQKNLILKAPKKKNKNLPGTKLLIKMAKERENDKLKYDIINHKASHSTKILPWNNIDNNDNNDNIYNDSDNNVNDVNDINDNININKIINDIMSDLL